MTASSRSRVVGDRSAAAARPGPDLEHERRLWRLGHQRVAGLDEVGRGAWAGPVSVGVAVVRRGATLGSLPRWLRDSKQLGEERREAVFDEVAAWCAGWAVGHSSACECDCWGMTGALRLAAFRALAQLEDGPDAVIVDGPHDLLRAPPVADASRVPRASGPASASPGPRWCPERRDPATLALPAVTVPAAVMPLVGADARCAAVAAASVLAKVVRDRLMRGQQEHFPAYCFERNKGYPSPAHQRALRGYGLSAIHRRSWSYVDDLPWR